MKKIITAVSVLTFATTVGNLTANVLNTTSQKNDSHNNIQQKTQQDTIYIDENGNYQTTSDHDLALFNSKEIIQIGFYQNQQGEIQVVRMPITVEKVPTQLPAEITSLKSMFDAGLFETSKFNQDLSSWNTTNVKNMSWMFKGAKSFNQDISKWNVSNVTDMSYMFIDAASI